MQQNIGRNLVPRAFFENAAKGKGPGIGWSFMYFDWSMTRTFIHYYAILD
jgi:hypothetical protein